MTPQRSEAHIIGDDAVDLVKRSLPRNWIVRNQGGINDYGIDVEIELVDNSGGVSGVIFKGQVKGHMKMDFSNRIFKKSISIDKLKYWLDIRMPVILFEVDTSNEKVYWKDIQQEGRRNYSKFNQDSVTIAINEELVLTPNNRNTSTALVLLLNKVLNDYNWRESFRDLKEIFMNFVSFVEIWERCKFSDFFLEMDSFELNSLQKYYILVRGMCKTFYIVTDEIQPFNVWCEIAENKWDGLVTYDVGRQACESIMDYTIKLLELYKKIVCDFEKDFWENEDIDIQRRLCDFEIPKTSSDDDLFSVLQSYGGR